MVKKVGTFCLSKVTVQGVAGIKVDFTNGSGKTMLRAKVGIQTVDSSASVHGNYVYGDEHIGVQNGEPIGIVSKDVTSEFGCVRGVVAVGNSAGNYGSPYVSATFCPNGDGTV